MVNVLKRSWKTLLIILMSFLAGSLLLGWLDHPAECFSGCLTYFVVGLIAAFLFWLGSRVLASEEMPRSTYWLAVGAAVLRLALGAVFLLGVPEWGHDNEVQNAGYIYEDAYGRDQDAWALAQSDKSLFAAFQGYSHKDQYGGMLFLSAGVYRFLGGDHHQPLLVILITATSSGLAVLFAWAAGKRLWGSWQGTAAAWMLALYPEIILLGSSQMRESFLLLFSLFALYGLIRFQQERRLKDIWLIVVPLLLAVPLSFSFSFIILLCLAVLWLALEDWALLQDSRIRFAVLAAVFLFIVMLLIPDLGGRVIKQIAGYQEYLTERSSGWVQKIFDQTPDWFNLPFVVLYGMVRPLLPAAIFDDGILFWRIIELARALGWTTFLGGLLYSSYLVIRRGQWKKLTGGLVLVAWAGVLIASYRGGGDQWDNPRYRAIFSGFQALLLAWTIFEYRANKEPWLKRIIVLAAMLILVFSFWYARRYLYFPWPLAEITPNILFGLVITVVYWVWDIFRSKSI